MIISVNITSYLLAKQTKTLEKEFLQESGLQERMSQSRNEIRKKQ
jgi:four helix bundle suffix protein